MLYHHEIDLKLCVVFSAVETLKPYLVHVDTVTQEEVAQGLLLQGGEGLQHGEGCVFLALGDQAQTQVHSIYRGERTRKMG